ncbi:hypothetical protein FNV43_RR00852 [Rhamnella rubrinervis]|uniref:Uncharacterized protein n=1 Tax=Rhamnella rubrinervis TaxID=2594499 RepID=A0A8K0MRS1_9ROSA|nr:hypothetical protein FNV43_RR00852 [Rhamnella rubrinervis]
MARKSGKVREGDREQERESEGKGGHRELERKRMRENTMVDAATSMCVIDLRNSGLLLTLVSFLRPMMLPEYVVEIILVGGSHERRCGVLWNDADSDFIFSIVDKMKPRGQMNMVEGYSYGSMTKAVSHMKEPASSFK